MSIAELASVETADQPRGLTDEQSQEAEELYKNYNDKVRKHEDGVYSRRKYSSVTDFPVVEGYLEKKNIKKASKTARENYEDNAQAYHEQAVIDAEKAGHDIAFSGAVAKNVKIKQV